MLNTLMVIMQYNGGLLCRDEISSIIEVRLGLEHMAVARAIEDASDDALKNLE